MKNLLQNFVRVVGVAAITLSMSLASTATANATEKQTCQNKDQASYCASKQVDKAVAKAGETLTYTLFMKNTGNVVLNDVRFAENLPSSVSYVAGSGSYKKVGQNTYTGAVADNWIDTNVTYNGGKLNPGQTLTVTFKATVKQGLANGHVIENLGLFTANEFKKADGKQDWKVCAATTTVKVEKAQYSPSKTVDKKVAKRGDILNYTLKAVNTGNVTLTNFYILDQLPTSGVTYVPGSTHLIRGNSDVKITDNWIKDGVNAGNLAPGATVIVTFQVKVNNNAVNGLDLENVGNFRSTELPEWMRCAVHTKVTVESTPTPTPTNPTSTPTPTPTPTGEVLSATPTPTVPPVAELPSTGPGVAVLASLGGIVSALWGRKYYLSR